MKGHRCQGRRRYWRGRTLGTWACTKKATRLVITRVGMSRTQYVCDEEACLRHVTDGYPAEVRSLT